VSVQPAGDAIEIAIADRGLGVPREYQQTIFERFGRAHGTAYGGLGLGLAISRGIIEQHGGTIRVYVRIPRAPSRSAGARALDR
jgi:signal transduction histidine kinase